MHQISIRQLHGAEKLKISRPLMAYAFRASPPLPTPEEWEKDPYFEHATLLALFEDETALACAAYTPMPQNVRGKLYNNGAVWGVATHPAARRRGYARQVLLRLFATMRGAGIVFSTLYPFRESFYDRLGYTTFPRPRTAYIRASAFLPLLHKELPGRVSLTTIGEGYSAHRAYLRRQQSSIHGMALFPGQPTESSKSDESLWLATALVENEPRGMMLYKIKGNGDNMEVPNFLYDDSCGKYLLLAWFARHVDQVAEIELQLLPGEQPETWIPDLSFSVSLGEAPMSRIIDVAAVGGMNCGPGMFSAHVSDAQCPWNEGRYLFTEVEGRLHVSSSETAQCTLTIQGLTALLCGTHDPESFAVRGWGNPTPALQETMRSMFPPLSPYLYEKF
jgi:predicted acetyltransferase